jgi:hypothetical protein
MNKPMSIATVAVALSLLPVAASASPCGVELCLSDFDAATNVQECKKEMDEFFSIIERKNGKFSPSRTLKKRRNFLYRCESGNDMEKESILARFGAVYKPSY